jgi:hypothetical protein
MSVLSVPVSIVYVLEFAIHLNKLEPLFCMRLLQWYPRRFNEDYWQLNIEPPNDDHI